MPVGTGGGPLRTSYKWALVIAVLVVVLLVIGGMVLLLSGAASGDPCGMYTVCP